jgi:hypothetical protein
MSSVVVDRWDVLPANIRELAEKLQPLEDYRPGPRNYLGSLAAAARLLIRHLRAAEDAAGLTPDQQSMSAFLEAAKTAFGKSWRSTAAAGYDDRIRKHQRTPKRDGCQCWKQYWEFASLSLTMAICTGSPFITQCIIACCTCLRREHYCSIYTKLSRLLHMLPIETVGDLVMTLASDKLYHICEYIQHTQLNGERNDYSPSIAVIDCLAQTSLMLRQVWGTGIIGRYFDYEAAETIICVCDANGLPRELAYEIMRHI